jgi:AraC-like DNA-binding protein
MFLFAQLFVREKKTAHIMFALFCGSIAIMATKKISGDTIGAYQYLIGMGACATCNGYWLLSRSLFREKNAISLEHIGLAIVIALLIMANQGYLFVNSTQLITPNSSGLIPHILSELTVLLSSSVIMLSFWEGCRGYSKDNSKGKAQRLLFLVTFGFAVALSKLSQGLFVENPEYQQLVTALIILIVLANTQILMLWRFKRSKSSVVKCEEKVNLLQAETKYSHTEQAIADKVETLLIKESLYLKTNLKVGDIARELDVPEYIISKALRNNLCARNFNQYVNELRIKHAKRLLTDPDKQKWPVLVVGLESGFASVGPFTRTFKLLTGFTPNQYRQNELT